MSEEGEGGRGMSEGLERKKLRVGGVEAGLLPSGEPFARRIFDATRSLSDAERIAALPASMLRDTDFDTSPEKGGHVVNFVDAPDDEEDSFSW